MENEKITYLDEVNNLIETNQAISELTDENTDSEIKELEELKVMAKQLDELSKVKNIEDKKSFLKELIKKSKDYHEDGIVPTDDELSKFNLNVEMFTSIKTSQFEKELDDFENLTSLKYIEENLKWYSLPINQKDVKTLISKKGKKVDIASNQKQELLFGEVVIPSEVSRNLNIVHDILSIIIDDPKFRFIIDRFMVSFANTYYRVIKKDGNISDHYFNAFMNEIIKYPSYQNDNNEEGIKTSKEIFESITRICENNINKKK